MRTPLYGIAPVSLDVLDPLNATSWLSSQPNDFRIEIRGCPFSKFERIIFLSVRKVVINAFPVKQIIHFSAKNA
jgi:hypothetical protein